MINTPKLLYRIDQYAPIPTLDSVKSKPLTSLEIDGNFRSIIKGFQSIPDIVTNQNIDDGTDLDDLVDHKAMLYYVDNEISNITSYIDGQINDLSNSVEVVTNDDIWNRIGLDKYIDHKALLYYKEFTSRASYWIDSVGGDDNNDGRSIATPWKTMDRLTTELPTKNAIYITVNLKSNSSPQPYNIPNDIVLIHSDLVFQRYWDTSDDPNTLDFPTLTVNLTYSFVTNRYSGPTIHLFSSKVRIYDVNVETPLVLPTALITVPDFGDDRFLVINQYAGLFFLDPHSVFYCHASDPQRRCNITVNDGLIVTGGGSYKIVLHSCHLKKSGSGFFVWPDFNGKFDEWNCTLDANTNVITAPQPSFPSGTNPATDLFWNAMSDFPVVQGLQPAAFFDTAGFQKFAGGFIVQWGKLVNPNNVAEYVFPIEFDSIMSVVCSYTDTAASDKSPVLIPISMSKFKVKTESTTSSINYIAIGTAQRVWP